MAKVFVTVTISLTIVAFSLIPALGAPLGERVLPDKKEQATKQVKSSRVNTRGAAAKLPTAQASDRAAIDRQREESRKEAERAAESAKSGTKDPQKSQGKEQKRKSLPGNTSTSPAPGQGLPGGKD